MKSDGNNSSLNMVLAISLVALAVLCVQFYFKSAELRRFQSMVAAEQGRRMQLSNLNNLMAELIEYGKTHPQMDALLESEGINVKAARGNAPKSTTK